MGAILSCVGLACCGVSSLAGCLCRCCSSGGSDGKLPSPAAVRLQYLGIVLLLGILASVLYATAPSSESIKALEAFRISCGGGDISKECFGIQAVYRVSFAGGVFFALLCLASLVSYEAHAGYFGPKLVLLIGVLIGAFFIPGTFFVGYGVFARVVACIFLVLQAIAVIDWGHWLQEYFMGKLDEEDEERTSAGLELPSGCCGEMCGTTWRGGYVGLVGVLYGVTLAGISWEFWFASKKNDEHGCPESVSLTSLTLVLCFAVTVLSTLSCLKPDTGGHGLMPSAAVSTYAVLQLAMAFFADPVDNCNPAPASDGPTILPQILSITAGIITLLWSVQSASQSFPSLWDASPSTDTQDNQTPEEAERERRALLYGEEPPNNTNGIAQPKNTHDEEEASRLRDEAQDIEEERQHAKRVQSTHQRVQGRPWTFHLVLAIGCVYFAMLLTRWKTPQDDGDYTRGSYSNFWVQIASQWVTVALFTWTLFAQSCCPNRDFSG